MTPLLSRVLTRTLAQLRVADDTRVLAVQEDTVEVFVLEVRVFQGGFDVFFREACVHVSISTGFISSGSGLAWPGLWERE